METRKCKSVLIVDRDAGVRSDFETALRPYCSELWVAASAPDALEILADRSVDLLLLDLRLPGIDGLAVLKKIERDRRRIRVFLLVDDPADDAIVEARRHGVAGVITKPVSVDEIRAVLSPELNGPDRRDP